MTARYAVKPSKPAKAVVKRKVINKEVTFVDVRVAASGGEDAFATYIATGKIPTAK